MTFVEKMADYMCYCLSVASLHEILDDMVKNGYGDALAVFRIGHTDDGHAVCFPLADIKVDSEKTKVWFTPFVREDADTKSSKPQYDIHIDINNNDLRLNFEEVIFEASQENCDVF